GGGRYRPLGDRWGTARPDYRAGAWRPRDRSGADTAARLSLAPSDFSGPARRPPRSGPPAISPGDPRAALPAHRPLWLRAFDRLPFDAAPTGRLSADHLWRLSGTIGRLLGQPRRDGACSWVRVRGRPQRSLRRRPCDRTPRGARKECSRAPAGSRPPLLPRRSDARTWPGVRPRGCVYRDAG